MFIFMGCFLIVVSMWLCNWIDYGGDSLNNGLAYRVFKSSRECFVWF